MQLLQPIGADKQSPHGNGFVDPAKLVQSAVLPGSLFPQEGMLLQNLFVGGAVLLNHIVDRTKQLLVDERILDLRGIFQNQVRRLPRGK
ncbi:hypothetical protein D3C75_1186080 [compost metagenome]